MKRISLIICLFGMLQASAQDRYFAQTYTSNILPKGDVDFEFWHTSRMGHKGQFFHAMDQRMEAEVGLGHKLQTSFYFNRYQTSYTNSLDEMVHKTEIGFSNEWKWKMSRPTSSIGTALYGELGVKGDELELETKFIADKSFGKNLLAFNLVYEIEKEIERSNGKTELETEGTPVELDLAYMRQLSTGWGLGFEFRNNNEIKNGNWQNSVLYAGPTVNYRGDRWFVIGNFLPQLGNLHKTSLYPANKVLDDRERAEARILFGFSF